MTITGIVDNIVDWLNEHVCPEVLMRLPSEDGKATNKNYNYTMVHPHAFPLYLPTRDKLPPKVKANVPSVTVQLEYGNDDPQNREVSITLNFSGWAPGTYEDDWIIPEDYEPAEGEIPQFRPDYEGWRELWNFVDKTAAAVQSTVFMGDNVEVMQWAGMEFGPYREEDTTVLDYHPFWYAYLKFKVRCSLRRLNEEVNQYL